ncbi:MAG: hypothetical protein WB780_07435 [Candidatus Acidiferrales bacterium]
MKITIESTSEIVQIRTAEYADSISCRVWEGQTESGIKVQALIPRIAALKTDDLTEFERELQEQKPPSAEVRAFPMRMII